MKFLVVAYMTTFVYVGMIFYFNSLSKALHKTHRFWYVNKILTFRFKNFIVVHNI